MNIYDLYFIQSEQQWKEDILDSTKYPKLSSLRTRSLFVTNIEKDMKLYLLVHTLTSSASQTEQEASSSSFPSSSSKLLDFLQNEIEKRNINLEALSVALFNVIDNPGSIEVPLYEKMKVDIEVLRKWRKIFEAKQDLIKCIGEILLTAYIPYNDFSSIGSMDVPSITKLLEGFIGKINEEYELLKTEFKNGKSLETAKAEYQILTSKGNEVQKKKILEDPHNISMKLFYFGEMPKICKQFSELLTTLYPEIKLSRKIPQGHTRASPTSQQPKTSQSSTSTIVELPSPKSKHTLFSLFSLSSKRSLFTVSGLACTVAVVIGGFFFYFRFKKNNVHGFGR